MMTAKKVNTTAVKILQQTPSHLERLRLLYYKKLHISDISGIVYQHFLNGKNEYAVRFLLPYLCIFSPDAALLMLHQGCCGHCCQMPVGVSLFKNSVVINEHTLLF